jgi:uncharacterized zinc-type alcohol dehydrogenase-like protein
MLGLPIRPRCRSWTCAEHGITAGVEGLLSGAVDEALGRLERGDVRYRFVLDLSDLG